MVNKLKGVLALMFLLLGSEAFSLEAIRGQMKLVLHENTGRYSLYFSKDLSSYRFTPIFTSDDPTTSGTYLLIDGKETPLAASGDFRAKAEATPTGAQFTFTSTRLDVVQSFDFITSAANSVPDGIRITYTMTNKTSRSLRVQIKKVLDTYLGEKSSHFYLKDGTAVTSELALSGPAVTSFLSQSPQDTSLGLLFSLDSEVAVPNQIIFANWKRINSGGWEMLSVKGRDFNMLPYSFNDSAVAVYYSPLTIESSGVMTLSLNLGSGTASSFQGARVSTDNSYSDLLDTSRTENPADLGAQLAKDKGVVQDLLNQIDQGLSSGKEFSAEDLRIMQAIMDELNRRKLLYR